MLIEIWVSLPSGPKKLFVVQSNFKVVNVAFSYLLVAKTNLLALFLIPEMNDKELEYFFPRCHNLVYYTAAAFRWTSPAQERALSNLESRAEC